MLKQKEKVIFVLFLLSCIFLSMSFVSAESNITDNFAKDIDSDDLIVTNNSIKFFKDLNNEINGDLNKTEIILNDDYFNLEGYDYNYLSNFTNCIFINRSLTIDGQGHVIDANGTSSIFCINADNVILKNINFKNARVTVGFGGAVFCNASNLKVINSTFTSNSAGIGGGAIYCNGLNITIINSTFIENFASSYWGSAICCEYNGIIINSTFTDNYIFNRNTAVFLDGNLLFNLYNESISYAVNSKKVRGVVAYKNNDSSVIIANSTIRNTPDNFKYLSLQILKTDKNFSDNNSKVIGGKIKKIYPKIIAKNKSFKNMIKIKKYAVILKNNKNKPIMKVWLTLKIKGKVFKAKTNKNGKAIFKIMKLNKNGKYKAKIIFKGNDNYNRIYKFVKLILK